MIDWVRILIGGWLIRAGIWITPESGFTVINLDDLEDIDERQGE